MAQVGQPKWDQVKFSKGNYCVCMFDRVFEMGQFQNLTMSHIENAMCMLFEWTVS